MTTFFFEDTEPIVIEERTRTWLHHIISSEGKKPGDLQYIFCSDDYLLQVNRDYLQHDYYTDIITFDYVKGQTISGDIFVSLQRISDNAAVLGQDFDRELHRVLAHGVLHLCGYKDKTEAEISEMRFKEDYYLARRDLII
ncbi:rRNA maturation RNase YbeY [Chryseobacterium sp. MFBS3-17]|uniref:rRNA maturation RNase YbeY n=1 Tax=Chryseobacterium sp. MFBS3-17 TaxID=2886689 RepID=UPI001D0E976F|nr:rRNA maturation RNase YbeY [Chryseobacterium sp. MFBS3-17]MCC2590416.1 rRNA maturation RNase YbeY [Chryseobacterium sp. MFBS3-17]